MKKNSDGDHVGEKMPHRHTDINGGDTMRWAGRTPRCRSITENSISGMLDFKHRPNVKPVILNPATGAVAKK